MNEQSSASTFYLVPPAITYQTLRDAVAGASKNPGRDGAALGQWMAWHERMDHSEVGPELGDDFPARRNGFLEWSAHRIKPGTLANRGSAIRFIHQVYEQLSKDSWAAAIEEGETLQGCLRAVLAKAGLCSTQARKRWGGVIWNYLAGDTIPGKRGLQLLEQIEEELGAPTGYLTRFAVALYDHEKVADFSDHIDPHRVMITELTSKQYSLRFDLPEGGCPQLRTGWDALLRHQTTDDTELEGTRWTLNVRGECPTALRTLKEYRSFFGWATLPKGDDPHLSGLGLDRSQLSFAMIGHWDLWRAFMIFRHLRCGGGQIYSGGTAHQLNMFVKLTHPETGWLTQTEDQWLGELARAIAAAGYDAPLSPGFFADQCSRAKRWRKNRKVTFEKRRDPGETLARFLAVRSPMKSYIYPLIARMEEEMPPTMGNGQRHWWAERRLMAVVAFFSVPMRLINWQTCRVGQELIRDDEGIFHLRVNAAAMKARGAMRRKGKRKGYLVRIPAWAQRFFAHYVDEVLPLIPQGETPYLLPNKKGSMIAAQDLRRLIQAVFRDYFGFSIGPHAARHIVATDFLKDDPANVYVVAVMLADTVETVVAAYADLFEQEIFEHWDLHSSAQAEQVLAAHGIRRAH